MDRANTRLVQGNPVDATQIFTEVTQRAAHADRVGYHRFWVAEHHSVPGIVGSAPTLLLPHLAAATSNIRLGTGGIMVPSHQPFVIAEQIGTLQALIGDRFDAGLGASVGFTKPVRTALRQSPDAKENFSTDVDEIISYLDGTAPITSYPQDEARTPLHVLTGGGSAAFAGTRGTGLVLGGPAVTNGLKATRELNKAVVAYRNNFQTAPQRKQPSHIIASINVAVAETRAEAADLVLSEAWALTRSRSIGVFQPLEDPVTITSSRWTDQEHRRMEQLLATTVYGTQDDVVSQLQQVVEYTAADEIMVTGNIGDPVAQQTSDRLLLEAWNAI